MTDFKDIEIGDTVVMTKVPDCVWKTAPGLRDGHDGILRVYQRAVARRSRLGVTFRDEYEFPWVEYGFRNKRGVHEHHAMQIEDDSYDVV